MCAVCSPAVGAMGVHYQSNSLSYSLRKYLFQLMSNMSNMSNVSTFSLKPAVNIMSKFIVRKNVGGILIGGKLNHHR